ncbi:MAG: RNA polymerase sigma factor [Planctomycetota bacterium]
MGDDSGHGELSIDLVRRIQDGDTSAWDRLYLRYRDRLLLSIRCRLGPHLRSRLQSEDILHSVVREVIGSALKGFEPRGGRSLERYLHACVLNKICAKAGYHAAQKRAGEVPLSEAILDGLPNAPDSAPRYRDAERYERLERALANLASEMREAVMLRGIEGLSNLEASQALGKTPEAMSKLYNRAIAKLSLTLLPGRPAE